MVGTVFKGVVKSIFGRYGAGSHDLESYPGFLYGLHKISHLLRVVAPVTRHFSDYFRQFIRLRCSGLVVMVECLDIKVRIDLILLAFHNYPQVMRPDTRRHSLVFGDFHSLCNHINFALSDKTVRPHTP